MTDDNLVKQWDEYVESMGSVMGDVEHMTQQMRDRIEALTAERDRAYASGYSDAETEISKSALGQSNTFLHSQYDNAKLRIEALTAAHDQLWDALSILMEEYVNEVDPYRVAGFYRDPETEDCVVKARTVLNKKL